jgi:hypothetical protein
MKYSLDINFNLVKNISLLGCLLFSIIDFFLLFSLYDFLVLFLGLLISCISFLNFLIFFHSKYKYWTSFFICIFFFIGYQCGLLLLFIDKERMLSMNGITHSFTYSERDFILLFIPSIIGGLSIMIFLLASGSLLKYPRSLLQKSSSYFSLNKVQKRLFAMLLFQIFLSSLAFISAAVFGVGVIGVRVVSLPIPFVFGFFYRLSITFIPILNIAIIYCACLLKKKFFLLIIMGIFIMEMLFLGYATLSKLNILFYIFLPLLYIILNISITKNKMFNKKVLFCIIPILLIIGLAGVQLVRNSMYSSLLTDKTKNRDIEFGELISMKHIVLPFTTITGRVSGLVELSRFSSVEFDGDWKDISRIFYTRDSVALLKKVLPDYYDISNDEVSFVNISETLFSKFYAPFSPNILLSYCSIFLGVLLTLTTLILIEYQMLKHLKLFAITMPISFIVLFHVWGGVTIHLILIPNIILYLFTLFFFYQLSLNKYDQA